MVSLRVGSNLWFIVKEDSSSSLVVAVGGIAYLKDSCTKFASIALTVISAVVPYCYS